MKVHYDKDEDILMLVLSDKKKKIDDAIETEHSIVEIAKDGEPLIITILEASRFFKEESKALPREIKQKFFSNI